MVRKAESKSRWVAALAFRESTAASNKQMQPTSARVVRLRRERARS
jgi:hypothetical protein